MKKVRAFNLDGSFAGVMDSFSVGDETRRDHHFKCLDPECNAKFHWIKGYKRDENTKEVDPTFGRNPSSKHREGCKYDYEVIASRNSAVSFYKDGKYFLRVNFPMGGSWSDLNPRRGRLTRIQRQTAEDNTGKKSVSSIAQAINFLNEQFGSLDHPALEDLYLDYQGRSYAWKDVFVTHDDYTKIFNAAVTNEDVQKSIVATLMPNHQISDNNNGKKRFQCTFQYASVGGRAIRIAPVLVCEDDRIAAEIGDNLKQATLAVSRPFIPRNIQEQVLRGEWRGKAVPVYMYLAKDSQITTIDNAYWRDPGSAQMTLDLDSGITPAYNRFRPK